MSFELPGLEPYEISQLIPPIPHLVAYRGSHSHGTYVAPEDPTGIDDIDIIAMYISPGLSPYFGVQHAHRGHDVKIKQWDAAAYEIRHCVSLLAGANPNVLSMLWVDDYISISPAGQRLVDSRDLFSTKVAADSFMGYAYSQLRRMTAVSGEGSECCEGEKFHLADCPANKNKGRGSQKKFATGFMGAKRKALVQQFGYDCKNAAHLIRLLRMGLEFLETGVLNVDRRKTGDAQQLIDIKQGKSTLLAVQATATALFERFDEAKAKSRLPERPDPDAVDNLLVEILSVELNQHVSAACNRRLWREHYKGKERTEL